MLAFATLAAILFGQRALAFAPSSGRDRIIRRPRHQSPPPSSSSSSSLRLGDFFNNFGKPKVDGETAAVTEKADEGKAVTGGEGYYDEDDPIEKIFGFFFGKKEEAPLG
jgi:hypothetical protein